MMQSEFLSRREREHRAKTRRARLDAFMNNLASFALGMIACLIITQIYDKYAGYDYSQCDYVVAAGNLGTAPIPSDRVWNEITLTPGGNWCIATDDGGYTKSRNIR